MKAGKRAKAARKTRAPARKAASKKTSPLFTIGYEKSTPNALIEELKRAKVSLLVDTRAVAASRKPGFSKRQLAATLDENGIAYIHLQKLGTPASGREAARKGDTDTLWRIYEKHVRTASAQAEMDELVGLVGSGARICLLCFERDVDHCHRKRIAELYRPAPELRLKISPRRCSERGGIDPMAVPFASGFASGHPAAVLPGISQ